MDPFLQRLWHIYQLVHKEGVAQKLQLGIHRSDYMIDVGDKVDASAKDPSSFRLTQIEINTIASAFGGLSTRLQRTHQRILNRVNNVRRGITEIVTFYLLIHLYMPNFMSILRSS